MHWKMENFYMVKHQRRATSFCAIKPLTNHCDTDCKKKTKLRYTNKMFLYLKNDKHLFRNFCEKKNLIKWNL